MTAVAGGRTWTRRTFFFLSRAPAAFSGSFAGSSSSNGSNIGGVERDKRRETVNNSTSEDDGTCCSILQGPLAALSRRCSSEMDAFDLLVVNGLVVTASDTANYDIAIKDGKIALLAPPGVLGATSAKRVIDAEGGYVMV